MNTKWENWEATLGQVTAEYEAKRVWAEKQGRRLKFTLYIQFEANDRFYVKVKDWRGLDVLPARTIFGFDRAIEYLSDVNCEMYVPGK